MVFDSIQNAWLYDGLGTGIQQALLFFMEYDAAAHQTEPLTLHGGIVINPSAYRTGPKGQPQLESHRAFIDVMYVAQGEEALYFLPQKETCGMGEYDPEIDASLAPLGDGASKFHFSTGYFALFFPGEAHCPGQIWETPCDVKKLVAKVPAGSAAQP